MASSPKQKSEQHRAKQIVIRLSDEGMKCLNRIQRIMGFQGKALAIEQALRAYALDPGLSEIERRQKLIQEEELDCSFQTGSQQT